MKRTSLGSRLVRIAARSPARSSTGPEVCFRFTPISRAMMCARVVLPSPGGPKSSAWSSASPRWRAASMKTPSSSRIFACPTYTESCLRLRARSSPSSTGEAFPPEISRSASITRFRSRLRQGLQRLAYRIGELQVRRQPLGRCLGLTVIVAKSQQRAHDLAARGTPVRGPHGYDLGQLVAQLQHQALGRLLPDARNLGEPARVPVGHRRGEVVHREAGEHRESHLGSYPADLQELAEGGALCRREEAEEQVGIFAHHEMREQRDLFARPRQRIEGAHRHVDLVAHAVAGDDDLREALLQQDALDAPDHRRPSRLAAGSMRMRPERTRRPRAGIAPRPPCAWQIAQARASAASGPGRPGSCSRRRTISCTCSLRAWPCPTTACFTWSAVYS